MRPTPFSFRRNGSDQMTGPLPAKDGWWVLRR